jgi:hypothetical protein
MGRQGNLNYIVNIEPLGVMVNLYDLEPYTILSIVTNMNLVSIFKKIIIMHTHTPFLQGEQFET